MVKNPHVSIITVVYNRADTLEKTIQSVSSQDYENKEYIIIDGGSTDGTLNIIKRYENVITTWKSEADKGIYDAMNEGIRLVRNDDSYILFLNADDYLISPNILSEIFSKEHTADFIYGNIKMEIASRMILHGAENAFETLSSGMIHHQATFTKKKLFNELGAFDLSYRILADYDFAVRVFKHAKSHLYIDKVISVMKAGGVSNVQYYSTISEKKKILKTYYTGFNLLKGLSKINFYEIPRKIFVDIFRS